MRLFTLLDKESQDNLVAVATGNSDAYLAYLQMFDTNNIRERKELLPTIVELPKMGLLFLKNCRPSMIEKDFVFTSILHDKEAIYQFLSQHSPSEDQIDRALDILIEDSILAYNVAKLEDLNTEQRRRIYERYRDKHINDDIKYLDFCLVFKDCISDSEKEKMVDIIYSMQDKQLAKAVLDGAVSVTQNLKEKLESILVLARLYRKPLSV